MKKISMFFSSAIIIIFILNSCASTMCEKSGESRKMTVSYEILDPSDCGMLGFISDGEFFLEINAANHPDIFITPIKSAKGEKDILKTNIDFKDGELVQVTLKDENQGAKLVDYASDFLKGFYKIAGPALEIARTAPLLKSFLKNFIECGTAQFKVNESFLSGEFEKEIIIKNSDGEPKLKMKIFYTCR